MIGNGRDSLALSQLLLSSWNVSFTILGTVSKLNYLFEYIFVLFAIYSIHTDTVSQYIFKISKYDNWISNKYITKNTYEQWKN